MSHIYALSIYPRELKKETEYSMEMIGCHINKRGTRIKSWNIFFSWQRKHLRGFFFWQRKHTRTILGFFGDQHMRAIFKKRTRADFENNRGLQTRIRLPL